MDSRGVCLDCKAAGASKPPHIEMIGKPVLIEISFGRGKDRTEHSSFQCSKCGSIWMKIEDSGAGGHGRYYHRLTERFF